MTISEMQAVPCYVTFEVRAEIDGTATAEQGKTVYKDVDYAIIHPQGANLIVEKVATEWLEQKRAAKDDFHEFYAKQYQAWKDNQESPQFGTPLKMWTLITPAQLKSCTDAGVRSIEEMAVANETTLGRIGMGARKLKADAEAWLKSAEGTGKVAAELATVKAENETLKGQIEAMREDIEQLQNALRSKRSGKKEAA